MLNNVVLQGRLTAAPELRTTTTGKNVCTFRIACDRNFGDKQADFIDCAAWNNEAVFINSHFFKGSLIFVCGSLQSRNYEDKNGQKRTSYEVIVREAFFGDSKKKDESDFDEVF